MIYKNLERKDYNSFLEANITKFLLNNSFEYHIGTHFDVMLAATVQFYLWCTTHNHCPIYYRILLMV